MSTHGIRVFNAAGGLIFDPSHGLGRIIGRINTGVSNGSYTYPGIVEGQFFAALMDASIGAPGLIVSGKTITWQFGGNPAFPARNTAVVFGSF